MHILNNTQVRQADQNTILRQGITSTDLMERAAGKCTEWLLEKFGNKLQYSIFSGAGNNGGDGIVIARLLKNANCDVRLFVTENAERSTDNQLNLERAIESGIIIEFISEKTKFPNLENCDVLIDALLGSGLNRALEGFSKDLVLEINKSTHSRIISIDAPSGFFTDQPMPDKAVAVEADFTLSFQVPKLFFFFPESHKYTGRWQVLDIGLVLDEANFLDTLFNYTVLPDIQPFVQPRHAFSHKGTFGHALLAGGSPGKAGAMILAARACLRAGAGLTTALVPGCAVVPLQSAVPEAMVIASEEENGLRSNAKMENYSAIGFGPGAGMHNDTAQLLKHIIQSAGQPLVIDADGLNILSENLTWLAFLPVNTILTPHPGELDRLAGKSVSGYERLQKARELSRKNNVIVILKGAFTAVVLPDGGVCFNSTGNPGMATGGSGDVLTGIITGLLAQEFPPSVAALLGVFLHGLAGDIAAKEKSEAGMIAGDIVEFLGEAWKIIL